MARQVRFTHRATEDLHSIWQHIARDSERYASGVAARIVTAAEDLAEYPRVGHQVEQIKAAEVREVSVYPYRLFYAIVNQTIWVLAVTHGSRDLDAAFFNRLKDPRQRD